MKGLHRPEHIKLTHGRSIWSGPFFPNDRAAQELNQRYAEFRRHGSVRSLEKLCQKLHGFSEALTEEVTSDGYVNDLIVWIEMDDHGALGILFPQVDEHGKVVREICFFVKGAGQSDIDTTSYSLSGLLAASKK